MKLVEELNLNGKPRGEMKRDNIRFRLVVTQSRSTICLANIGIRIFIILRLYKRKHHTTHPVFSTFNERSVIDVVSFPAYKTQYQGMHLRKLP